MDQFIYKAGAGRQFRIGGVEGRAVTGNAQRSSGDVAILTVRGPHGGVMDLASDRFYVVTEGSGTFFIGGMSYPVQIDDVVVIPPNTAYDFAGEMKLVMFCSPPFDPKNDVARDPMKVAEQ